MGAVENIKDRVSYSVAFITVRTFLLGFMSIITFTIWLSWNFSVPFQLLEPSLVGWSVAIADIGRLIGASGLIFFPQFLHKQYYLQSGIGLLGCGVGLAAAYTESTSQIVTVFLSLFLIGVGSNPQLVNAMANVDNKEETRLNSIAFSLGKFVSFGVSLFTLVPIYGMEKSWAALSMATAVAFCLSLLMKLLMDKLYPRSFSKLEEEKEDTPIVQSALDVKKQVSTIPLFVWVILISVSARGNPRSLMISMGPWVFYDHWHLTHSQTSYYYFVPLVLSGLLFPVFSLALQPRSQLLVANLLLAGTVAVFPFLQPALASADLCGYGMCAAVLESVRVPLLKSVFGHDYNSVTRMVGMQHFIYTMFYAVSAAYSGLLYNQRYWLPFVVSGSVHLLSGFAVGYAGIALWQRHEASQRIHTDLDSPSRESSKDGNLYLNHNDSYKHETLAYNC